MITDDDWAAFEADMSSIDTRPPIIGDCDYHDWGRCQIDVKYYDPGEGWGGRIVIIRGDGNAD